jgi:hypothetical protein
MAAIRLNSGRSTGRRWPSPQQLGVRLLWQARRVWQQLGWAAAIGIACVLLALLAWWQTQASMRHQQALTLQLQAAKATAPVKPMVTIDQTDEAQVARQLSAFYAYLPAHEAIPDQLKRLITLAQKAGVTLAQADYKVQPEAEAGFLRFQIILPVKAEYRNIQSFMQSAFQELPTLTLESIAFKREKIESNAVEARIQYLLLVKKAVPKGRAP